MWVFLIENHAKIMANLTGWRENPQTEGDIIGLIQVWELPYRQRPHEVIDTKGDETKKFTSRSIWGPLFILKATRVRIFPRSVDIRGKNVFFSKFCIQNAALQNGDILGSNNRTETVDTAMKSVDDKFLKN